MGQSSINIDKEMGDAMEELKAVFGVTTNAAVLKRAVAISRLSAKNVDEEGNFTLLRPDGKQLVIPTRF
jgi:hypothetical protein